MDQNNITSNILSITYYTYNYIVLNKNIYKYLIWGNDANNGYLNILKNILNYNYNL